MTSQLFTGPTAQPKAYGHPYNGRYHMPLLPGEQGPKDGSPHVSNGIQRMTNLVGAFEDTRALSIWEQGMALIGLAKSPELYEELVLLVAQAERAGVDFERLRDYTELKETLAGTAHDKRKQEASIVGRAKHVAKAGAAAARGTNDHTAWEHFGKTGEMIGTQRNRTQVERTAALLADAGLEIVPGLSERIVRNTTINAVGKFDNILMERRTGRLIMADLKTKATAFYSWMTVDAQLAGYASAQWMLREAPILETGHAQELFLGEHYEEGPLHYVDQNEGVILHVPSDGSPAFLRRADLVNGRQVLEVARRNIELRAYGKSAGRHAISPWMPPEES